MAIGLAFAPNIPPPLPPESTFQEDAFQEDAFQVGDD